MEKGDWITVSFRETDDEKTTTITHTGEILSLTKRNVTIASNDEVGEMTFPLNDENYEIKPTRKRKLNRRIVIQSDPEPVVANKPKRSTRSREGSKKEQAIELYKNADDQSKDAIIELFMDKLEMSKAGATTYYYMAKKGG